VILFRKRQTTSDLSMNVRVFPVFVFAWAAIAASAAAGQQQAACTEWRQCRQMALSAAAAGEYETFHDLAWRAVQTGPKNDPSLMYLLARAQALSGRPHDALVMLQRLADMGVSSDAATSDDFARTRQLPGWSDVVARLEQLKQNASPAAGAASTEPASAGGTASRPAPGRARAAATATPGATAAPSATERPPDFTPAPASEELRFSTGAFALAGFAYDVVSRRFLFGDRLGRKLIVVGEGLNYANDLVRAESAGFHDIAAIEIDEKRGDLWVASSSDETATLHRLQLVSGRPLKSFPVERAETVDRDGHAVKLVDLAITPAGSILALDSGGPRIVALHAGATAVQAVAEVDVERPVSIAPGNDERSAYIAHRGGVSRVDLQRRRSTPISAPADISLDRIERIRWFRNGLVVVESDPDGSRRIVRFELNPAGTSITKATTLEGSLPASAQTSVTISGDDLLYLVAVPGDGRGQAATELVAYRVHLR
jgi:hypothetical protein